MAMDNPIAFQVQERIAQLSQALLSLHPQMPTLLRDIHTTLRANPDVVTLLTDQEIGVLVSSLKKQTGVAITTSAASKKPSSAALKKITVDDL